MAADALLPPLPAQPADVPWPTAKWPEAALPPAVDAAAVEALLVRAFADPEVLGTTRAVAIVQGGRLVAERYGPELDAESHHVSWSMAKSMLHVALGGAVGAGWVDVAAPLCDPSWREEDPRGAITWDQLLHMRSGLAFREDYEDEGGSDVIAMLFGDGKDDVAGFAAAFPLEHEPGSHFYYSSGTTNILSAGLSRALATAGREIEGFLREGLFDRIGMSSAEPRFDAAGHWIASSFVFATARDFARFGLLALRDGVWEGERLVPEGWMDYGRRTQAFDEDGFGYGAHWWTVPGSLGMFRATGYNGQRILLVPPLDLVVVRLGETPKVKAPGLEAWTKQLVDAFRPLAAPSRSR